MRIYTKTGDDGSTGLFGGNRVQKDSAHVEAYGTVDELNSVLGVARAELHDAELDALLHQMQDDLLCLGAELACVPGKEGKLSSRRIDESEIARLEQAIDVHEEKLAPLRNFILPGGTRASAALHLARTVCRRAERRVLSAGREASLRSGLLIYLNRLADLLFVLARRANQVEGRDDVAWVPRG
ncbi:MAG: cob(I)yrinic acid a,c-diamide adenosyltransferase [Polyangiaceae bacterium]